MEDSHERRHAHKELIKEAMRETFAEGLTEEDRRRIVKQAIDEWLDKKYAQVGLWTLGAMMAATVAVIGYVILLERGWRPPH